MMQIVDGESNNRESFVKIAVAVEVPVPKTTARSRYHQLARFFKCRYLVGHSLNSETLASVQREHAAGLSVPAPNQDGKTVNFVPVDRDLKVRDHALRNERSHGATDRLRSEIRFPLRIEPAGDSALL
jgi:hypothetical protein